MLTGKKVQLRPIMKSDVPLFIKWFNDPEVNRYLLTSVPMSEIAEEKWIEEACTTRPASNAYFVIEALEKDGAKPIGNTGLTKIDFKNQTADFGIAIGEKNYWNGGYGTEASRLVIDFGFKQLNLHHIASFVLAKNERSLRLHKKLGFMDEGIQREVVFKNGEFNDVVAFGMLRDEWRP